MAGRAGAATRTAALWVPDWPVAAAVAEGLVAPHLPVAVHDGRGVSAVSAQARAEGVRRGMRRRSAQGVCPGLALVWADEGREIRAFEPLVQAVESVVAGVEVVRPGLVLLPARGPSRHVGSESALAELLVGRVAEETGSECQVGIADGVLAAVLAARDGRLIPAETSAEYLAPRAVGELRNVVITRQGRAEVEALTDLLVRFGLRTLGAFAALGSRDVVARFGEVGAHAHRLARGWDARPPVLRRPENDVVVRGDLDPPVARLDVAAFAARRLAEQLHERMLRRGVVCARLRVEARTESGQELVRTWRVEGALTAGELTDRVRWQLEGWIGGRSGAAPSAPLVRLELAAEEVSPANVAQDGLWSAARRDDVHAARAALRIQGLLGADGVLVPVAQGGRDPRDRVRLVAWGDEETPLRPTGAPWPGQIPSPMPATVPTEPQRVQVLDADGQVVRLGERGRLSSQPARVEVAERSDGASIGAAGRVEAWAGPWPVTERWWSDEPRRRAYLQVVLADGPAVLVAADSGAWWLEGVYG